MSEAAAMMDARQADAIIVIPPDFTDHLEQGHATVQVLLYGVDATTANAANTYIASGFQTWQATWAKSHGAVSRTGTISVVSRQWFNDANTSSWMFVLPHRHRHDPGRVFLTSLVMAREWERGTLEAFSSRPSARWKSLRPR